MKKNLKKVIGVGVSIVLLTSCGGIKSDAKKVAALKCEAKEALESVSIDDMSGLKESKEIAKEVKELTKEMKDKYSSETEWQEYTEALALAMEECD